MPTITTNFPVDLTIVAKRNSGSAYFVDRLRGSKALVSQTNAAETNTPGFSTNPISFASNIGWATTSGDAAGDWITLNLRRAPGFFDVVTVTGQLTQTTFNHNLGSVPGCVIIKIRNAAGDWFVYHLSTGSSQYLILNSTAGQVAYTDWCVVTSTTVTVKSGVMGNGNSHVVYLFANCPGVSKVGSYTGNGSSQTINCGFTGGARFVLIKRTDSTGDWYVWDTARGIVAGNDPHLSLNSTAAEVTTNDSIDTDSTGFIVNQLAATNINVSSATYIFLAIA